MGGWEQTLQGAFYPPAEMWVAVTAANLYERVICGNRTLLGGGVSGWEERVTHEIGGSIEKEESLLSSVYLANGQQFYELSASSVFIIRKSLSYEMLWNYVTNP